MAENLNNLSPKGCVDFANRLIQLCKLPFPRITSIENINSCFLVSLFERVTGFTVPDLLLSNDSTTEVHNIQAVIDTLSLDILDVSLSHITAEDIVNGDVISILNLLEVLEAVFCHLNPEREEKLKDAPDKLEIKVVSPPSDEIIPSTRVLKRKTCKNTLRKFHQNPHVPKKKAFEISRINSTELSHSKRHADNVDGLTSPSKRKISKSNHGATQHLHIESIEDLYNVNFEKKIRSLLKSDLSPIPRAQQLKKKYIQILRTPLKKRPLSPCKKSFLLPHDLRNKKTPSILKTHIKKKPSRRKNSVKCSISENAAKSVKCDDLPAIIQTIKEEFPGFKFPKSTLGILMQLYHQHLGQMHKQLKDTLSKKPTKFIQIEKAVKDQEKLSKILNKDLKEKKYLQELNEQKIVENRIKYAFRDARIESAKIRQYFDEFHTAMRRRMQKRNFSEEMLITDTFKEILNIQKENVRLLCQRVKETDKEDAKQHRQYLDSLTNLYQQQLDLLAEAMNAEQKDSLMREKTKRWAEEKMHDEFRKKLQKEIHTLQKDILEIIEDIHFRELDAQNFIQSFQQQDS